MGFKFFLFFPFLSEIICSVYPKNLYQRDFGSCYNWESLVEDSELQGLSDLQNFDLHYFDLQNTAAQQA